MNLPEISLSFWVAALSMQNVMTKQRKPRFATRTGIHYDVAALLRAASYMLMRLLDGTDAPCTLKVAQKGRWQLQELPHIPSSLAELFARATKLGHNSE